MGPRQSHYSCIRYICYLVVTYIDYLMIHTYLYVYTYLLIKYLLTKYLPIKYLSTYYIPMYIPPTYLFNYQLPTYVHTIYLPTLYLYILTTYLPTTYILTYLFTRCILHPIYLPIMYIPTYLLIRYIHSTYLLSLQEILYYVTIQFATTCDYPLFAIIFHNFYIITIFLIFLQLWCDYYIVHPSILINFFGFSSKNGPLCLFSHKFGCILITFCGVPIHFMYIKPFWTTLRINLNMQSRYMKHILKFIYHI